MKEEIQELSGFRHQLHAHPEIAGCEKNTADRIREWLSAYAPTRLQDGIGGYGLLAEFDFAQPGPTLLFRSEMDALPIEESGNRPYQSRYKGFSHACGHDGHTAILLGLASRLSQQPLLTGRIVLLFQPAEETGAGAERVCRDPRFDIQPDYVFALHNLPGHETGSIVVKDGYFSAAVKSMVIRLTGKTSHAAEPEKGINPAMAVSEIICLANGLNHQQAGGKDFQLVTPVHIRLGSPAYGTSAGDAELHFTLRCYDNERLDQLTRELKTHAERIAEKDHLGIAFDYLQAFHANNNDPRANAFVREAAAVLGYAVEERKDPFHWGEDFGFFTSAFPGCMFGLGAGVKHPALHNPDYDFPDKLIGQGVNMFYTISQLLLNN